MTVQNKKTNLDDADKKLIRLIQDGISFEHAPFAACAAELGISEHDVIEQLNSLIESQKIRRFGASIGHIALGFTANGMCVWDVPPHRIEEVGQIMASFKAVSHCYERPRFEEWPYNMYTMIHGRSKEDCEYVAKKISEAVDVSNYEMVFSEKEFKKKGVRI